MIGKWQNKHILSKWQLKFYGFWERERERGREREDLEARERMGKVTSREPMMPFLYHLFQNRLLNQNLFLPSLSLSLSLSFSLIKLSFVNFDRTNPFWSNSEGYSCKGQMNKLSLSLSQCFHSSFFFFLFCLPFFLSLLLYLSFFITIPFSSLYSKYSLWFGHIFFVFFFFLEIRHESFRLDILWFQIGSFNPFLPKTGCLNHFLS